MNAVELYFIMDFKGSSRVNYYQVVVIMLAVAIVTSSASNCLVGAERVQLSRDQKEPQANSIIDFRRKDCLLFRELRMEASLVSLLLRQMK